MTARQLIDTYHGPTKFHQHLEARGILMPLDTVLCWSSQGVKHREPPHYVVDALAVLCGCTAYRCNSALETVTELATHTPSAPAHEC